MGELTAHLRNVVEHMGIARRLVNSGAVGLQLRPKSLYAFQRERFGVECDQA
jgi:hypothetical protein